MLFNADSDFAAVIDGLQAVTVSRASGGTVNVSAARLVDYGDREALPAGGGVLLTDQVWDLLWPAETDPPDVGDELQPAGGLAGEVLSVELLGPGRRCRCTARTLVVSDTLGVPVELQSAVWGDLGSGPEITGWTTLAEDVPAHIQPVMVELEWDAEPTASTSTFTISLPMVEELELCERVVAADGAEYRVDRILDQGRLDALPILEVTQTQAAT